MKQFIFKPIPTFLMVVKEGDDSRVGGGARGKNGVTLLLLLRLGWVTCVTV